MKGNSEELLSELENITTHHGFVSSCLDLKESMLFYDKGLILAGYSSGLEGLIVCTLFVACLESEASARRAFEKVREISSNLPSRIMSPSAPLDVQAMIDDFVKYSGWVIYNRVPVFISVFSHYLAGDYRVEDEINRRLRQVQGLLREGLVQEAIDLLGRIGCAVLRGARLRQCWTKLADPRLSMWLRGIQNMITNLVLSGYASVPLGPISQERDKRKRLEVPGVIDLGSFRETRRAHERPEHAQLSGEEDEIDRILDRVIEGEGLDGRDLRLLKKHRAQVTDILLTIIENDHLRFEEAPGRGWAPMWAARVLGYLKCRRAIKPLMQLIANSGEEDPAYMGAVEALRMLGPLAANETAEFMRSCDDMDTCVTLAGVLEGAPKSDKVFDVLVDVFQRAEWYRDKESIALSLAHYGDARAIPVLEKALNDLRHRDRSYEAAGIRRALEELQGKLSNSKGDFEKPGAGRRRSDATGAAGLRDPQTSRHRCEAMSPER